MMMSRIGFEHTGCYALGKYLMGILLCLAACSEQPGVENQPETGEYGKRIALSVQGEYYIDSAQVFFMRRFPERDSLVSRQVIYDVDETPDPYFFEVPAGPYAIVFFGNVSTGRMVARPPFSRDSIWFDYGGTEKLPSIYYGLCFQDVGVDTSRLAGMVLMTSWVELTVRQIPDEVASVRAVLNNTGVGFYLSAAYIKEQMNPPLQQEIELALSDTVCVASFSCFPTVTKFGQSTLDISCYDAEGKLLFTGSSAVFKAHQGLKMVASCTFQRRAGRSRSGNTADVKDYSLSWDYAESGL